jgi:hypothetical protein
MRPRFRRFRHAGALLAGALLCAVGGCPAPGDPPEEVARRFWSAVAAGRFAEARTLSTAPSDRGLRELAEQHAFAHIGFQQVLSNENAALVESIGVLEGDRKTEIVFNTHLARFDGGWRVETDETRREIVSASLTATVEDVKESLHESAEILSEAIERGALEFSEALREAMEGVEDDLRQRTP